MRRFSFLNDLYSKYGSLQSPLKNHSPCNYFWSWDGSFVLRTKWNNNKNVHWSTGTIAKLKNRTLSYRFETWSIFTRSLRGGRDLWALAFLGVFQDLYVYFYSDNTYKIPLFCFFWVCISRSYSRPNQMH